MEGNSIRIIVTGVLVCMMMVFGCPEYLHGSGLHVALTHHFFHVNIFHLAANALSIWLIFGKGRRYGWKILAAAYLCATLSWYSSSGSVAGMSNMIFALLGLRTPSLRDRWWRQSSVLTFLIVTVSMALIPNISTVTHLTSFILGGICAAMNRFVKRIKSDYARASYN